MTALLEPVHTPPPVGPTGRAPTRLRLRGRAYRAALVGHVLASVGWFGVALAVLVAALAASTTADTSLARSLYTAIAAAPFLSMPAGLVAVATGGLLGLGTAHGLARHWWVLVKAAIAAAVLATDATLIGHAAHRAAAGVPGSLLGPACAHVVVLGLATGLSVFKPWGRTRWARSGTRATGPARTSSHSTRAFDEKREPKP